MFVELDGVVARTQPKLENHGMPIMLNGVAQHLQATRKASRAQRLIVKNILELHKFPYTPRAWIVKAHWIRG